MVTVAMSVLPVRAAGTPSTPPAPINWQQRDTAVYVVSTVNLLRARDGSLVVQKLGVARFDVYDDLARPFLYYIELRGANGANLGALAYRMGWSKPLSLSPQTDRLGIRPASPRLLQAYRADRKQLIGTFTSTVALP